MSELQGRQMSLSMLFEKSADGRYRVSSGDLPDLHLAGADWDALKADIDPVIKELLERNSGIAVTAMQWLPSFSTVTTRVASEGSVAARLVVTRSKHDRRPLWLLKLHIRVLKVCRRFLEWARDRMRR